MLGKPRAIGRWLTVRDDVHALLIGPDVHRRGIHQIYTATEPCSVSLCLFPVLPFISSSTYSPPSVGYDHHPALSPSNLLPSLTSSPLGQSHPYSTLLQVASPRHAH